jgi:hypothetical protein
MRFCLLLVPLSLTLLSCAPISTTEPARSQNEPRTIRRSGLDLVLPDGTRVTPDRFGAFQLPNGDSVFRDARGELVLPNGSKCAQSVEGYTCP